METFIAITVGVLVTAAVLGSVKLMVVGVGKLLVKEAAEYDRS